MTMTEGFNKFLTTVMQTPTPSMADVMAFPGAAWTALSADKPDPTVFLYTAVYVVVNAALLPWTISYYEREVPPSLASRLFWATYHSLALSVTWVYGDWTGEKLLDVFFAIESYSCDEAYRALQPAVCLARATGFIAGMTLLIFVLFFAWLGVLIATGLQVGVEVFGAPSDFLPPGLQEQRDKEEREAKEAARQKRYEDIAEKRRLKQQQEDDAPWSGDEEPADGDQDPKETDERKLKRQMRRKRRMQGVDWAAVHLAMAEEEKKAWESMSEAEKEAKRREWRRQDEVEKSWTNEQIVTKHMAESTKAANDFAEVYMKREAEREKKTVDEGKRVEAEEEKKKKKKEEKTKKNKKKANGEGSKGD